jgi:peroxiredoxin
MMKKILFIVIAAATMAFTGVNEQLALGDSAPMQEYEMMDISGQEMSLKSLAGKNGLVVIFSCNTCPFVLGWEGQYPMLANQAGNAEVGFVLVNSNEAKREGDDSIEEMKKHAKDAGYNMPYVVDANSELANAFGANTTPHVFMFDGNMKLVYKGSINDKYEQKDKVATTRWLHDAMMLMAAGNASAINPAETKNIGCSIKRK